jgi:hypothetical protein
MIISSADSKSNYEYKSNHKENKKRKFDAYEREENEDDIMTGLQTPPVPYQEFTTLQPENI